MAAPERQGGRGRLSDNEGAAIEPALREHVLANYAGGGTATELDPDHDLLASGQVDSMGVMEIIGFIENAFSVTVDDEDIVPENFRSLRAMADYIMRKQDGSGGSGIRPPS